MRNKRKKFDLSIVVAVFNQKEYIGSCADSILKQDFSGEIEILIVDDCSTDESPTLLESALRSDSRLTVRVLRSDKNEYQHNKGFKDWATYYAECHGVYVAFLDCDDYWIDASKLSKQRSFLDRNAGCSMCFHDYIMVNDILESNPISALPLRFKKNYTKEELRFGQYAYILFGTVMCRNFGFKFPPEMRIIENVDLMFPMYMSQFGECHFCDDISPMIYRQNSAGIWSGASALRRSRQKLRSALLLGSYLLREDQFDVFEKQAIHRIKPEIERFLALLGSAREEGKI